MAAYYPLFEDDIKEGPPGIPGIGFKLTNDGNYDMERKGLKNVLDPQEESDSATKNYVDGIHIDMIVKMNTLTDSSMIHGEEFFNAKQKYIKNLGDPRDESDAATKSYVDGIHNDMKVKMNTLTDSSMIQSGEFFNAKQKYIKNLQDPREESDAATKSYVDGLRDTSLIHDAHRFDAKHKFVSNVKWPEKELDAVNKQCLVYSCILWDKDKRIYYAHNERISSVKAPQDDTDCVNKHYVDTRTFCATTSGVVQFTGVGYKMFQFNEFTSKLLDKNLKLQQNMYMKITIFLACDNIQENPLIRLEKMQEVLQDRAINVNEESITMFAYGRKNDILTLSVLTGGRCKLKPYLHIEKLEFHP